MMVCPRLSTYTCVSNKIGTKKYNNMIITKQDLRDFLDADRKALGRKTTHPHLFDFVWKFQISLRYYEFFKNRNSAKKNNWIGGGNLFVLGN